MKQIRAAVIWTAVCLSIGWFFAAIGADNTHTQVNLFYIALGALAALAFAFILRLLSVTSLPLESYIPPHPFSKEAKVVWKTTALLVIITAVILTGCQFWFVGPP